MYVYLPSKSLKTLDLETGSRSTFKISKPISRAFLCRGGARCSGQARVQSTLGKEKYALRVAASEKE